MQYTQISFTLAHKQYAAIRESNIWGVLPVG